MKKAQLFVIFALILCCNVKADIATNTNKSTDKYSHWSIMVSGGFNMLVCERTNGWVEHELVGHDLYGEGIMGNYRDNFAPAGLFQADYMVSPQFGFRLQYLYAPINKEAIYTAGQTIFSDTDGQSHQATVQLNVNLLNIFYRCRKDTKFNWYAGVGVGAMFFKIPTFEKYRPVVCIPMTTSIEYSPIKSMAIVLHAELDWYGDDEVNGVDLDDQVNDMGLYVGLGLRYHINAIRKKHVRNSDMCNMDQRRSKANASDEDDEEDKKAIKGKDTDIKDLEELQDKVDEMEKRNRELSDKIELMNRDIMERMDKYFTNNPDTDNNNQNNKPNDDSSTKSSSNSVNKNTKENDDSKNKSNNSNTKDNNTKKSNTSSGTTTNSKITSVEKNKSEYTKPVESNITSVEGPSDTPRNLSDSKGDKKQEEVYYEAMMSNGTEANEVIFDIQSSRVKSKFEIKIATVAKRMLANKNLKLYILSYLKPEERTRENVELATKRMEAVYYILVNRYMIDQNRIKYDIVEPDEVDTGAGIRCDMVYR